MSTDKNSGGTESVLALVLYFAREGYWHHVQTVADQVIKKRGRAPVLSFWKAYAVAREGEYAASIRNFDDLRSKREVCFHCFVLNSVSTVLFLPLFCFLYTFVLLFETAVLFFLNHVFVFFNFQKKNRLNIQQS